MAKMTPFKKAVVTTGTYTDREGNEKKRYLNVGVLFKYEDGGFALKLEALPVGDGWNGFVSFFDMDDRKEGGTQQQRGGGGGDDRHGRGQDAGRRAAYEARESYDLNDDIPFIRAAGSYDPA